MTGAPASLRHPPSWGGPPREADYAALAGAWISREIADEARYKERSGLDAPFTLTHTLGGLTLTAVNDYVRTFAEAFTTEHTPVYGHLAPLGR